MMIEASTQHAIRQRLLEGVLLRLSRRPDAKEYVLRGGLLMRHWFRPVPRSADDLDLIAMFPFDIADATRRFLPVLELDANDGVTYDPERTRVEGIWLDSATPGVRVFASGVADDVEVDFNVDLTFGPPPRPAAVFDELPTACGQAIQMWMCRPEAVVGQKVQALWHRGTLGWRPKDLNDLRLLLARVSMNDADLRRAIMAYLADVNATRDDVLSLFGQESWWEMKLASARWFDFAQASREQRVPQELSRVITEIAGRLVPILEGSP